MKNMLKANCAGALLVCLAALSACDKLTDTSRAAQSVTQAAFEDTKSSWRDFFMYHPPMPEPLPQTRYCYQMQSDVVCYDSEQRQLTSKLVGYQDGENISWVQPGGGSLGASGGEPIALRPLPVKPTRVAAQQSYAVDEWSIDTGPVDGAVIRSSNREAWQYDQSSDVYRNTTGATSTVISSPDAVSVSELPKGQ